MRTASPSVPKSRQELQTLILASLAAGIKHGYLIRKDIQGTFGRPVGQGALYGSLNALVAKGLIVGLMPVGNKQPYEITEAGKAQLEDSFTAIRKLAEVGPFEATQMPSYYTPIDQAAIDAEQSIVPVQPKVFDPLLVPFSQLGGRRFEILTYLLKREAEDGKGVVTLVKASRDGGRDVLVHRGLKLFAIVQCKNLQTKLSLPSLKEELLKLILHDYRERFIPHEGIRYELWAPRGLAESTEAFINSGLSSFQEGEWVEVFARVTTTFKKLSTLEWKDVRDHVEASLAERITILPFDGLVLTQTVKSRSALYSSFFDVLNVWKKEDVEQTLEPSLTRVDAGMQHLTAVVEGIAGDQIDEQINEARERINRGQFGEAQAALRLLERKKAHLFTSRQRFRVESNKGAIAYSQSHLEDAAQFFLQAVQLQPNDERAQENEVFAYYLLREFSKAHSLATKRKATLPLSARIASLWINTAPASVGANELIADIDPVLHDQHEVALALARRYMGERQIDVAEPFIRSAKLAAPKWGQPWLVEAQAVIGQLLEENAGMRHIPKMERAPLLQRGVEAASKAFDLSTADGSWAKAEALALRAQLYLMQDDLQLAANDAKAAYLLDAASVSVLLTLAQVHLATRALDQALHVLQEAYHIEARADIALMYSKGLIQRSHDGDEEEAWRVAAAIALDSLPYLMVFGVAAQALATASRISLWGEAEAYLKRAEPVLDEISRATLRSYLHSRQGDKPAALAAATLALTQLNDATHAQTVELLGQLLMELERPELAIPLFRRLFDQRIATFDPRQLLMCAYLLNLDDEIITICDELRTRGRIPWDVLEFELQQLEKYNIPKATSRLQAFLNDHPENKLARVRLSVIGVLHGLPELINTNPADMPTVEELPVEYLMPTLGVMRKARDGQQSIDFAYRYLRLHFDRREAHEAFIQVIISRADRETEPDLETVVLGAAVYTEETFSGQGRWFVLESTNAPLHAFEAISPDDPKFTALLGKAVGDTVVLAPASMGNREAVIKKILPKYVRRFQDCIAELQVRFGSSTMIQSVHVGGPSSVIEPALMSVMTSVRERAERIVELQKTYANQPLMSVHVFGSTLGKNSYESIQHLATTPDASVRCCDGNAVEANATLLLLRERSDLLLDLSTIATLRLLGLEWILSTKVHRLCMTQGTWEELRRTLIDDVTSPGRKGDHVISSRWLLV